MAYTQIQLTLDRIWNEDQVLSNYEYLEEQFKYIDYELDFDKLIFEEKGWVGIKAKSNNEKNYFSISLRREMVQIGYYEPEHGQFAFILLMGLLRENQGNILRDTLNRLKNEGKIPKALQKMKYDSLTSLYLDLMNGQINENDRDFVKQILQKKLSDMMDYINKIENKK